MTTQPESLCLPDNGLLDTRTFETVYGKYSKSIYKFIVSKINHEEDSKEIMHDIFTFLWANRERLRIESMSSYLYGMSKNQVSKYLRSKQCRQLHAVHLQHVTDHSSHTTEEMINLLELETTIERHVSQLPPKCREVFRMSRVDHLPISKISKTMNISTSTVENYITHALQKLRKNIPEYHRRVTL